MYFNSTFTSLNGGTGVYGIYSKGELIYIGYTANGYEGRWDQHRQGFTRHTNQQPMYRKYDIATIEFKPLVSEEDLQEVLRTDSPIDPELFQIIEYSLKHYNPVKIKKEIVCHIILSLFLVAHLTFNKKYALGKAARPLPYDIILKKDIYIPYISNYLLLFFWPRK